MSFLSNLFGAQAPPPPKPPPAVPTISSGQVEAADREQMTRLRARKGTDATILGGLGDSGSNTQQNVQRQTLLGGGGAVTS